MAHDHSSSLVRENARLRREVRARLEQQEALRRVAVMVLADWAAPGLPPFPVGEPFELGEGTALALVQAMQAPARVDSYQDLESADVERLRDLEMRAAVAAPILVDGRLWRAVAAGSADGPFPAGAEERLGAFAELVACRPDRHR